jgi:predicted PurR-regulated permease PerM
MSDLHRKATEVAVRLAVVGLLAYWCFAIFRPFLMLLVWAIVLAVALRPAYAGIERATGGRRNLAAVGLVALCAGVLALPTVLLSQSMMEGVRFVSAQLQGGHARIPPAPARVATWPLVGATIYDTWNLCSTSLETALQQFRPQVVAAAAWLGVLAKEAAFALLQTVVAVVLAAVLLARREAAGNVAVDVGARIGGEEGAEAVRLAGETIGAVAKGVVGVAAIQAALAAVGLTLAGIPGSGLWALLVLILAVAQLPPLIVLAPALLYLVATDASMTTVVAFGIWSLVVSFCDTLLKPLLLGRGLHTPVVVILIGAIGGLLLHGLIGLFVGAVVFSIGHHLFWRWMESERAD